MEKKGQTIFLSVVGIATLLVAIVGATFAWFSTTVTGTAKDITVTSAKLGTVSFTDGTAIALNNAYPGATATKDFTITADATSTVKAAYDIYLDVTANTLSAAANVGNEKMFVYGLSGKISSTGTDTVGGTVAATVTDVVVPGVSNTKIASGVIGTKGAVHTYTFTIDFKNKAADQNAAQGKTFSAKLRVDTSTQYTSSNPQQ